MKNILKINTIKLVGFKENAYLCIVILKTIFFLTSSLRTPKIFIKEFGDFLMSCHQHCLGVNLLVQR